MKITKQTKKKDIQGIEYIVPKDKKFSCLVIVTQNKLHSSGYKTMKYILLNREMEVVGCVGGSSDVLHIEGIGGYGSSKNFQTRVETRLMSLVDWSIDVLPCGYIRLFNSHEFTISDLPYLSDFSIYADVER